MAMSKASPSDLQLLSPHLSGVRPEGQGGRRRDWNRGVNVGKGG